MWRQVILHAQQRFGQLRDGVARVDQRAVTARPGGSQPQPRYSLLGDLHDVRPAAIADLVAEAASLADRLLAAIEQIGMGVDQPSRALPAAHLLVGQQRDHDVTGRPPPAGQPGAQGGDDHRDHVLHVDGTAAPHLPAEYLPRIWVHRPGRRVRRDHVQVHLHQQRGAGRVGAADARDDAAAPRQVLEQLRLEAHAGQLGRDELGGGALPVAGGRGIHSDQVGAQLHDAVRVVRGNGCGHGLPRRREGAAKAG
jgi:hypothetical protein